jgi:hypothetical protein
MTNVILSVDFLKFNFFNINRSFYKLTTKKTQDTFIKEIIMIRHNSNAFFR